MTRKGGLGRGLEALIPGGDSASPNGNILMIELDRVRPNPRQPRKNFDAQELGELTASIEEYGILQPLIVSADPGGDYVLVAGERRLQAARLAGLASVPAILRETTDMQQLELALIENVQRSDLNPLEQAEAYRQLAEEFNLAHESIARRVGKSRVAVSNTLRLLKLPDVVKNALIEERISEGHARAMLGLASSEAQAAVLKTLLAHELNVRQTEELVRRYTGGASEKPAKVSKSAEAAALEERLRVSLGTKVTLRSGKKGGTLTIHYYSNEELDQLLDRLTDEKNSV